LRGRTGDSEGAAREYGGLALVLHKVGKADEAIKVIRRGLKSAPGNASIVESLLAMLRVAEAGPEGVAEVAEGLATGGRQTVRVLALLAESRRRSGRDEEAGQAFELLVAHDDLAAESLPEVMEVVCRHHLSAQKSDEAFRYLTKGVEGYRSTGRPAEA